MMFPGYTIFAIRKDDNREFHMETSLVLPKDDRLLLENGRELNYDAFYKILVRRKDSYIIWKWDGEKASYV